MLPQYKSSRWVNSAGETISKCFVYEPIFIEVIVENPMRRQLAIGLVKVAIYKNNRFMPDSIVKQSKHIVTIPPFSAEKIVVPFKPLEESEYYYRVFIEGREVRIQHEGFTPRLHASRRECTLVLDKPCILSRNPGITVTGKLIDTITGEGIECAHIDVYDVRLLRSDELIARGITSKDGTFIIEGLRIRKIWGKTRIYAKFRGDDLYKPSVSGYYIIDLS